MQVVHGITSCAVNKNPNACINACGQGVGQGICQWLKFPSSSSCVANSRTCPDGECDELESLDWNICPQDCAEVVVPRSCKGKHGSGMSVSRALGVFWCDPSLRKCSCFVDFPDVENGRNGRRTTNAHSTDDESLNLTDIIPRFGSVATFDAVESDMKCDSRCVMLIAFGVCIPIMFCLLFFTWYIRRLKVRAGRPKYLGSAMSLSAVPSDYVDERSSSVVSQAISVNDTLLAGAPKLHVPIDSRWEFPRNQLIIEQTLGEGEFGRVMRAKAFGINGNPGFSTVAIKMLKNNGTNSELQDLLSEYNLLKEVSHHNVIKLLGACTDKGGPFYIIAEYAEHGSLRHYLRKSRQLEFDTYTSEDSGVGSLLLAPTTSSRSTGYQTSPADLLSFMWQISKGMAYLSEMKVVHRDLATRNILVATDKVVKISDFGLSRDIYEGDAYFKRSKGRVPVKWMAIESLINHIYTSKSDVWSFGIVMWEIVMLGSMPYPGVPPERLFYLLKSGYRMEKPDNCSDELYKIMMLCWKDNPHERPPFKELTNKLDFMLQDKVEYLDLGFNIVHNMTYFEDHQDDIEDEDSDSEDHDYGSLNVLPNNSTLTKTKVRSEVMRDNLALPVASTSQSHDSNEVVIAEAVV
uniref:receptor protein-tyrosine kinase n=1 Tax=Strigamia maritima TaxID=126957 RepID=T1J319_STRMM